jgi:hypothetical protein
MEVGSLWWRPLSIYLVGALSVDGASLDVLPKTNQPQTPTQDVNIAISKVVSFYR